MPILQMDPEFEFLIQERTTDYIEHLEEDIFDKGCTFPLYVWGDIIPVSYTHLTLPTTPYV